MGTQTSLFQASLTLDEGDLDLLAGVLARYLTDQRFKRRRLPPDFPNGGSEHFRQEQDALETRIARSERLLNVVQHALRRSGPAETVHVEGEKINAD